MTFLLELDTIAEEHLEAHIKAGNIILVKKIYRLFEELKHNPKDGTGKPHQLRYRPGVWSRRIDDRHRMLYTVHDDIVTVFVISLWGHYGDK